MGKKKVASIPTWTTDPQYKAFESDLTANPDDDTPRLVLADWLEEHGDGAAQARAEFIRVQIELSKLGNHDPRHADLTLRQSKLLAAHEQEWLGPLAKVVTGAEWRRGFPQRLKLGVRAFMDNADELFRQAPILHLQLLRINQTKMTIEELAACPHFSRLRGLSLPGSLLGDKKLRDLLSNADLRNLETLDLSETGADGGTAKAIAAGEFPNLRSLNLAGNTMQGAIRELFRDNVKFSLTHLDLGNVGMGEPTLQALFSWKGLAKIEDLSIWNNRLGNAGARALAASPQAKSLRKLNLMYCSIGMRGMIAVAESSELSGLRQIKLDYNEILPTGLEALLRATFIDNLSELSLPNNGLHDAGAELIAKWPGLKRLKSLDLRGNNLTAAGVEQLCSSPFLSGLTSLDLSMNSLGDEGAKSLAKCPGVSGLRKLEVRFCEMSDEGVEALLDSPHLKQLTGLDITYNRHSAAVGRRHAVRFHPKKKDR